MRNLEEYFLVLIACLIAWLIALLDLILLYVLWLTKFYTVHYRRHAPMLSSVNPTHPKLTYYCCLLTTIVLKQQLCLKSLF